MGINVTHITDEDIDIYRRYQEEYYAKHYMNENKYRIGDVVRIRGDIQHNIHYKGEIGIVQSMSGIKNYVYVVSQDKTSNRFWVCGFKESDLIFEESYEKMRGYKELFNAFEEWTIANDFNICTKDFEDYYNNAKRSNDMSLKDKVFQNHNEVELRNGDKYIVVGDFIVYIHNANCRHHTRNYDEQLQDVNNSYMEQYDIMKVTNPITNEIVFDRTVDMIDWSNIPVDTKVLVSDDGEEWAKRHFAKKLDVLDDTIHTFEKGQTSFTQKNIGVYEAWKYAKLYKEG